ncbi:1-phosphatidylinositol phosphodiesterase-like [Homalodisca vitripennis]|uniref:1-phosphatidylinositol phosphodiesterase-like n=1 Tax=Homalodisca vitripennis TaxID=197043 RepID=UPI001EEC974E|nr:1-phosphatidylinositol phosphodiesterase-like [Homalodisca vitripennis]XP_046671733.1 1-phosphatidylinositol phosphodiesterase-like [Homalodisca vitripennis]
MAANHPTLLCFTAVLVSIWTTCSAHYHESYMRNADDDFSSRTNWMSHISGDVKLSEMAIPGTHLSATYTWNTDVTMTQVLSFKQQLNYGVRFFDIRVKHKDNTFQLHSGHIFLNLYFSEHFLNSVDLFLKSNPSETVLVLLKKEEPSEDSSPARTTRGTLEEILHRYSDTYLETNHRGITLKRARGKFIIFSGFHQFDSFGLKYDDCDIQDNSHLSTNWDLYNKWESVKNQLENARNGDPDTFYINYLSGSGGSFPYFVASGHSSPGTSAPRLATGLTTPGWSDSYPDFPRVSCFIGICTIAFEGTNTLTYDKIREYNEYPRGSRRTVGIIVADFPGDLLISTIIRNNDAIQERLINYTN